MTLRATTYLGDNTIPILAELVEGLLGAGVDIEFDTSLEPGERDEIIRAGEADLVWACGLLTVDLIEAGVDLDIVAAPMFQGESGATYRSVIVVRADDPARKVSDTFGRRVAINEHESWSGYHGFGRWLAGQGSTIEEYPTEVLTGSHRNSALAIAEGVADVAAIDHTVWDHLVRTEPAVERLRLLTTTSDWPAPPFSVRRGDPDGLAGVLPGLRPSGLDRIVSAATGDYHSMRAT